MRTGASTPQGAGELGPEQAGGAQLGDGGEVFAVGGKAEDDAFESLRHGRALADQSLGVGEGCGGGEGQFLGLTGLMDDMTADARNRLALG